MNLDKELSVFDRIKFTEKDHSYQIDGESSKRPSVTRLLKLFKKQFKVEDAAARVAKRRGVTVETVKAEWKMNNLYSTTLGTMLHKYIENYYCNNDAPFEGNVNELGFDEKQKIKVNLPTLVGFFQNFYNDHSHYTPLRNEFIVGDLDDTKICGMLDMLVLKEEDQTIELWDFKTNKKMEHSRYGNLLEPFEDMSEGEINEYTIQLNTYKYLIEKYTNLKINKTKVIWFNVINDNYRLFELTDIQPKIKLMFEKYKILTALTDINL
jgi:ATP-dependent exoDNAse (exonuclease V) beta subunit